MKSILYAATAAGLAMLSTCGLLAWATAVPPAPPTSAIESELVAHLDQRLTRQLDRIKSELSPTPPFRP